LADLLAYRLTPRPVRAMASLSTITVSTFYMVAQMIGAGALVKLLLKDMPWITTNAAITGVGILMVVYVVFGGMLATTWVQIIKAILLMTGTIFLSILVLKHFDFSLTNFFDAISHLTYTDPKTKAEVTRNFLDPGMKFGDAVTGGYGKWNLVSLGIALLFGTAGLPHILVRFYTVPDAKTARVSVVWAMVIIGAFYILTTFLGFGAATILKPNNIPTDNMSAPQLAETLGGPLFFAFISAVAFATILAVVAGLTISASASFAHDFYTNVLKHGQETDPNSEVRVARITAFVVGGISIFLAIKLQTVNVAFLVGLAFAVAASANLPVIVLSIFWKRFSTTGAVAGLSIGLLASIVLIILSPSIMGIDGPEVLAAKRHLIQMAPIFPLENPGILSIPIGFLAAILGSLLRREPEAEAKFEELQVRAQTGLGAEKATAH
jgi:cation/acetate symporter